MCPAEASPGNVHQSYGSFVGRVGELREVRRQLASPGFPVLAAVHGLGGSGKTAVAVQYAHASAHHYGGGRWQVGCRGYDDLRAAMSTLTGSLCLDLFGAELADPDAQMQRVLAELRARCEAAVPARCLIILDDVESPELLAPVAVERLPTGDWLHVLVTTRLGPDELPAVRRFVPVDTSPTKMPRRSCACTSRTDDSPTRQTKRQPVESFGSWVASR